MPICPFCRCTDCRNTDCRCSCIVYCGYGNGTDLVRERLLYYAYVVFFGANSSLVLSGFAVLGIWAVGEIIAALRRKYSTAQGIAWILLLLTYLLENGALFLQIFGVGESTVSHKAEYALTAVSFWEQWKTNLLQGGQHSVDYHGWILLIAVFTVIAVNPKKGR